MRNFLLNIFIVFCLCNTAFSQSKTLKECVEIAWERNLNIKQVELSKVNSEIDLSQAKASRYPSLNAGSSLSISGRSVDPTNNQFASSSFFTNNYNLSSNVVLYRGGQVIQTIKRARQNREAADHQIENMKQDMALQVANSYMNVLFSQENLGIAEKRLEATTEQVKQLELLIERGLRPKNAIFDLLATQAADEQNVVTTKGNLDIAYMNLLQLMNVSTEEKFDLVIPEIELDNLTDPFGLNPKNLYEQALVRQGDYKNALVQGEIAETNIKIAKAGLKPSLGLGGSVGTNYSSLGKRVDGVDEVVFDQTVLFNGTEQTLGFVQQVPRLVDQPFFDQVTDNVTYGYGLSLQIPIYNNKNTSSAIQRAEVGAINADLNKQLVENQFRNEIEQVLIQAKNAKVQYEASEKSVEARKQAFENAKLSYEAGNSNAFDLTFATNAYDTALIQRAIAKYDYIFKALVIDFYMGKSLNF